MQIKKSRFFYKKGAIQISLTELMMALLAVAVILVIFYVGLKIGSMFSANKNHASTMTSFDLLGEKVDEIINDKNYANTHLLYYLTEGKYILVGFNFQDTTKDMATKGEKLVETRKLISGICGKACLCIYKDTVGEDFDENNDGPQVPVECKDFNKKIVFLAPSRQKNFKGIETGWHPQDAYEKEYYPKGKEDKYKFLILEGFNTKEIYLDKFETETGEIFIYMAEYDKKDNEILKREEFMVERYDKEK